jgi:hypothetical protein
MMRTSNFHISIAVLLTNLIMVFFSCEAPTGAPHDTTAPVPGDGGTLSFTNLTSTSLTLTWTAATDNATSPSQLRYRVVISDSGNIATVDEALSPDVTIVRDWTPGGLSADASLLVLGSTYYFNVIVMDSEGNTSAFSMTSILMTDKNAPVPGDNGTIAAQHPGATSQTIVWQKAEDDVDSQSMIEYKLVRSFNPDINSVEMIETYGHGETIMDWSADENTFSDSELTGGTDYYYNVLVRDSEANIGAYSMTLIHTPIAPGDVFVFTPGQTLNDKGFSLVDYMQPIDTNGDLVTSTAGLDAGTSYISIFRTPLFSVWDRTGGTKFVVECQFQGTE